MGLFADPGFSVPEIAAEMRQSVEEWMTGSIQIVDPNIKDQKHDRWTNQPTGAGATVLWAGKARIQPIRTPLDAKEPMGETSIAAVRFQIPIAALGDTPVRKGLRVLVVNPGEDPTLDRYQYIVRRSINSSMAWNRTIECEVDLGSVE